MAVAFCPVLTLTKQNTAQVKNIIVCGHYECGGVRASMANNDHGLIENWIMGVKEVAKMHSEELLALGDDELIHRRLVELNVQEQCLKVRTALKNGYQQFRSTAEQMIG